MSPEEYKSGGTTWIDLKEAQSVLNLSAEDVRQYIREHGVSTKNAVIDGKSELLIAREELVGKKSAVTGAQALPSISEGTEPARLSEAFDHLSEVLQASGQQSASQQELLDRMSKRLQLQNTEKLQSLEMLKEFRDSLVSVGSAATAQTVQLRLMQEELNRIQSRTARRIGWSAIVGIVSTLIVCTLVFSLVIRGSMERSEQRLVKEANESKAELQQQIGFLQREAERYKTVMNEIQEERDRSKKELAEVIENGDRLLNEGIAEANRKQQEYYEKRIAELDLQLYEERSNRVLAEKLLKALEEETDKMKEEIAALESKPTPVLEIAEAIDEIEVVKPRPTVTSDRAVLPVPTITWQDFLPPARPTVSEEDLVPILDPSRRFSR